MARAALFVSAGSRSPSRLAPILILSSLSLARAIKAEASLSFLGFGVDSTLPTWGWM
jgi:peptide/nickel transport system permease protein